MGNSVETAMHIDNLRIDAKSEACKIIADAGDLSQFLLCQDDWQKSLELVDHLTETAIRLAGRLESLNKLQKRLMEEETASPRKSQIIFDEA